MYFVKRQDDFVIDSEVKENDEILCRNFSNKFSDYVKELKEICGNPKECKFPDTYFGNIRPWDYERVWEFGNFTSNHKVLECGALHTYMSIHLSQKVEHYTATDSFYWANRNYAKNNITHQTPQEWCDYLIKKGKGKLYAEEADLQKMKYPDNHFDRVICISVIEHVHNDRQGVEEMLRVLKPGGLLLLTTEYNPTWSKPYTEEDESFYRVYDNEGINNLFKNLNIQEKIPQFNVTEGNFTTLFLAIKK